MKRKRFAVVRWHGRDELIKAMGPSFTTPEKTPDDPDAKNDIDDPFEPPDEL